ncbi:MAG: hypothetical protein HC869_12985 [Rhodospirillales bacterium]|nr:hypothetical protein [Rhodospirillales bacterium]
MSTVTYTNEAFAPAVAGVKKAPRKSLWRRLVDAIIESRQRRAEREIARFLASHGGLLTDDVEREIMRRITQNGRKRI